MTESESPAGPFRVGFCLLNWNSSRLVGQTLEMILTQEGVAPFIAVVDNGSEPDDANAAQELVGKGGRFLRFDRNRGYAEGMNHAIREITREQVDFVALLNVDLVFPKDTVRKLCSQAKISRFDVLTPVIEETSLEGTHKYFGRTISKRTGKSVDETVPRFNTAYPIEHPNGAFLLVRPEVFKKAGSFDAAYFAYWEEMDWAIRVRDSGFRIGLDPGVIVRHRTTSVVPATLKTFLVTRNRILYQSRHLSTVPFLQFLLYELIYGALRDLAINRANSRNPIDGRSLMLGEIAGVIALFDSDPPMWLINRFISTRHYTKLP